MCRHHWQFCTEDTEKQFMINKLREIFWDRTAHEYMTYKNSLPGLEKAVNIAPILERQLCTDFTSYVLAVQWKTLGLVAWLNVS